MALYQMAQGDKLRFNGAKFIGRDADHKAMSLRWTVDAGATVTITGGLPSNPTTVPLAPPASTGPGVMSKQPIAGVPVIQVECIADGWVHVAAECDELRMFVPLDTLLIDQL